MKGPRDAGKKSNLVSIQENFAEAEIFCFQMRTEQKTFSRPILLVSPRCACPMRKISYATGKRPECKSGFTISQTQSIRHINGEV